MDIKELDLVDPHIHWYYQSKLAAVRRGLTLAGWRNGNVVDVGAGSGFFAEEVLAPGVGDVAFCIDPHYSPSEIGQRGMLVFQHEADAATISEASLFLFMDVLEHVEDDRWLLQEYVSQATSGALVVITVPAFMSMWSAHDVFLEHYRRYRRPEVVQLAETAGLQVLRSQYLFGSLFGPSWLVRKLRRNSDPQSDMKPAPSWLNGLLRGFFSAEHRLGWNPVCGLSVLVVARVQ